MERVILKNGRVALRKNAVELEGAFFMKDDPQVVKLPKGGYALKQQCVLGAYKMKDIWRVGWLMKSDTQKLFRPAKIGSYKVRYGAKEDCTKAFIDGQSTYVLDTQLKELGLEKDDFGNIGQTNICSECGAKYATAECPYKRVHNLTITDYHSLVRLDKSGNSRLKVGLEIEKEDIHLLSDLTLADALSMGWLKESDSSLGVYGCEFVSHILSFDGAAEVVKQSKPIITGECSSECGGHIHVSDSRRNVNQLFYDLQGYFPLLAALYPNRTDHSYCRMLSAAEMARDDARRAVAKRSGTVELRIFPSPRDIETLLWRLRLVQYMLLHPESDPDCVLVRMVDDTTQLHKLLLEQYPDKGGFLEKVTLFIKAVNGIENKPVHNGGLLKEKSVVTDGLQVLPSTKKVKPESMACI